MDFLDDTEEFNNNNDKEEVVSDVESLDVDNANPLGNIEPLDDIEENIEENDITRLLEEEKNNISNNMEISTTKIMTKYEYAGLIGKLASSIANSEIDIDPRIICKDYINPAKIAKEWLNRSKELGFPFLIERCFPNGKKIKVKPCDLILPNEI